MHDYAAQRDYWAEVGPPPNISLLAIAAGLGVDIMGKSREAEAGEPQGPSIAEMAAAAATKLDRSGDTMAATREVLKAMQGGRQ